MPEKERPVNPKYKVDRPWISSGLKTSIKKKFELLRISHKSGLLEDNYKYRYYANKMTELIRESRNSYYYEQTRLYGTDKAKIWQLVNKISNFKRKTSTSIKSLVDKHGRKLTDPTDIANSLNDHFGSIGKFMAQKFDDIDSNKLKEPLSYISKDVQN